MAAELELLNERRGSERPRPQEFETGSFDGKGNAMRIQLGISLLLALSTFLQAGRSLGQQPARSDLSEGAKQSEIADRLAAEDAANAHKSSEPMLKPNPLEVLRAFEAPVDEEYRLGRGDEVEIEFTGRPEMLAKRVVGPDGRISLPLAGEIAMAGLTRPEAAHAIEAALSSYYVNLEAQVTVTKYTANRVLLLGAVAHPGSMLFDGTPTLIEAVTRAGVEPGTNGANQIPERCAIYRGRDKVVWVELRALLESGNPLVGLRLQRDDVIYVPSQAERFVSVMGDVQHPGAIPLTHNSTLASVIAQAGGFADTAGSRPHVQIVDPSTGTSQVVSFNDLLNPAKSLEITLKPGEIIYVPRSGFGRATYLLQRLDPLVSLGMMAFYTGVL